MRLLPVKPGHETAHMSLSIRLALGCYVLISLLLVKLQMQLVYWPGDQSLQRRRLAVLQPTML